MKLHLVSAGHYWTDAGAFFGVMPHFFWKDKVLTDDRQRLKMSLNLLLIQTQNRNILVDTGVGNRLNKRRMEIYSPSMFELVHNLSAFGVRASDITDVIMTHLHFDHAGGVITNTNGQDSLTFPQAVYHVQRLEWEMAKHPDKLNQAAYQFDHQLALLEDRGRVHLLSGDDEICENVLVKFVDGHTVGTQIVETNIAGIPYIYAGDIIPTHFHIPLAVTSAYDVSRQHTAKAKQMIYDKLSVYNGFLLLDHDTTAWQMPFTAIQNLIA